MCEKITQLEGFIIAKIQSNRLSIRERMIYFILLRTEMLLMDTDGIIPSY